MGLLSNRELVFENAYTFLIVVVLFEVFVVLYLLEGGSVSVVFDFLVAATKRISISF